MVQPVVVALVCSTLVFIHLELNLVKLVEPLVRRFKPKKSGSNQSMMRGSTMSHYSLNLFNTDLLSN